MKLTKGKWSPSKVIKKREVMLLASGPKAIDYKNELEKYIKLKKPFVIALNTTVSINAKLIDVFAACHPLRLIADANLYKSLTSPLVVPISFLSHSLKKKFKNLKLLILVLVLKKIILNFINQARLCQDYMH